MNAKKYRPFPQYIPTDGQTVWVVRFIRGADPIAATFSKFGWFFVTEQTSIQLDAWQVVEWRPR